MFVQPGVDTGWMESVLTRQTMVCDSIHRCPQTYAAFQSACLVIRDVPVCKLFLLLSMLTGDP